MGTRKVDSEQKRKEMELGVEVGGRRGGDHNAYPLFGFWGFAERSVIVCSCSDSQLMLSNAFALHVASEARQICT